MIDHPHLTVNRHLVTLVHNQPFLDWLLSADPNPLKQITLAELRGDNEAFLIPDDVANGTEDTVIWEEKNWRTLLAARSPDGRSPPTFGRPQFGSSC